MQDDGHRKHLPRFGLALKLAAGLVALAAVFLTAFGYFHLRLEQRNLEALVNLNAERISDLIRSSAWQHMLRNDRDSLYQLIRNIGSEPGIRKLRIFNEEGKISYSTQGGEAGEMVDKTAEACYACHAQEEPLHRLMRQDRARIFASPDGHRTLAVIRPIENHADCSTAACHVHPASRRILGVIDVHLALDAVDVQLAGHRRQIVLSLLLGAIGLCLFSVAFVWLVLHRPVRALLSGTNRLARGELATRLEVRSEDELGVLAGSFNHMAAELQRAHADLTDWAHTLETRVKQKTEELEQTHRGLINTEKLASLGKLAATVAHEVNNPLFGMLTYARLVRKDVERLPATDPARVRMLEHLAVIERESKRCGGLMKNLLAFARQSPPQRAPMNCNLVLRRAAELISHKLELNEIALGLKEDPALPEIQGDAAQLQQVLLALLVNAAEAIGRDGRITATTAALPAGEGVSISVLDTGPGIPYAIQTQIFEPFFSTKSSQHRTGLGLAISKGIVERHGGIITVRSDPGHGAEFLIQLPPAAPVHAAAGNSAEAV